MSHTFVSSRTNFIYDGDYTGKVIIVPHPELDASFSKAKELTEIPIEDLFDFAASMVAAKRISRLEDACWAQILGVDK